MFIWAHRGASGEFPENTLLAFEQAIRQDADGIELDVIQVEDEFYIRHDRYFTEDPGQPGKNRAELLVCDLDKDYLNSVQLAQNQQIPTLAQSLELVGGRVAVNVELKHIEDIDLLINTLQIAQKYYQFNASQLLISSFNHHLLEAFQNKTRQFPIGVLLASSMNYFDTLLSRIKPFSIHFDVNCVCESDVDKAHDLGLKCFAYTVDRQRDIKSLQSMGVDGIFTNFPNRTRTFL